MSEKTTGQTQEIKNARNVAQCAPLAQAPYLQTASPAMTPTFSLRKTLSVFLNAPRAPITMASPLAAAFHAALAARPANSQESSRSASPASPTVF